MVNHPEVPVPKFGKSALELLDQRGDEPKSLFGKYGIRVVGGVLGGGLHAIGNWSYKRPIYAGNLIDKLHQAFQ